MGHVTVLASDSVGHNLLAFLVLIPLVINLHMSAILLGVFQSFQLDKHAVSIGGHILAVVVYEGEHDIAILIQGFIVRPVSQDDLELFTIAEDIVLQLLPILESCGMEIDEEVDDAGKEVLSRMGEEVIGTAFLVTTALVEGSEQRGSGLGSGGKVGNILPLDGVHSVAVFHIGEIDDVEVTVLRKMTIALVLTVLIEQLLSQRRELVVIHHHGKALGRVLANEWVDDSETFAGSRGT